MISTLTFPKSSATSVTLLGWCRCCCGEIFGDRNLDDDRRVRAERGRDGVRNLVGLLHVHAARAVHLGEPVEARVDEIDADVLRAEVTLLLRLPGAVAAVVQHDAHERNVPADGGVDLLRRVEEAAVALQA